MEASESANFNLVAGSQGADHVVKYGANNDVGFLPGHPNGLVNLFGQIGPGHLAHSRRITKKSITALPRAPPAVPGWSATRTKLGCRSPGGSLQGAMEEYPVARPQQTVTDRASSWRWRVPVRAAGVSVGWRGPPRSRYCLSHFPLPRATSKPIGPRRPRKSSCAGARFACKDSIVGHGRRRIWPTTLSACGPHIAGSGSE